MVLREDCHLGDTTRLFTQAATASSREAEAPGGVLGPSPFATDLGRVTGSSFPKLVHWGLSEEGDETLYVSSQP